MIMKAKSKSKSIRPFHIHLSDQHIYSLQHRPPPTSPLVQQARNNLYFHNAPLPTNLADHIAKTSITLSKVALIIDAIDDPSLQSLVTSTTVQHARVSASVVKTLNVTMMAANAILFDQSAVFQALVWKHTTDALVRLTRADDLIHRVVDACKIATAHATTYATTCKNNNNVNQFSIQRPSSVSKLMKNFSKLSTSPSLSIPLLPMVIHEVKAYNLRLTEAREEANERLQKYEQSYKLAKEAYDATLHSLTLRADMHDRAIKKEKKDFQRAFITGSAAIVAKWSCLFCGKRFIQTLSQMKTIGKEAQRVAQGIENRLIAEKLELRRILRVHAEEMKQCTLKIREEINRIQVCGKRAALAKEATLALSTDDDDKDNEVCSVVILKMVWETVDTLRMKGSQVAAAVVNVCTQECQDKKDISDDESNIKKGNELNESDNNERDEMSRVAILLLEFYAGWGAVVDFCEECVYYVNGESDDFGRRHQQTGSKFMKTSTMPKRRSVGTSGGSDEDAIHECSQHLDSLIYHMKAMSDDDGPSI